MSNEECTFPLELCAMQLLSLQISWFLASSIGLTCVQTLHETLQ